MSLLHNINKFSFNHHETHYENTCCTHSASAGRNLATGTDYKHYFWLQGVWHCNTEYCTRWKILPSPLSIISPLCRASRRADWHWGHEYENDVVEDCKGDNFLLINLEDDHVDPLGVQLLTKVLFLESEFMPSLVNVDRMLHDVYVVRLVELFIGK